MSDTPTARPCCGPFGHEWSRATLGSPVRDGEACDCGAVTWPEHTARPELSPDEAIRNEWRKRQFPHHERDVFERYFADTTAEAWDEVRREVASVVAIVRAFTEEGSMKTSRPETYEARSAREKLEASHRRDGDNLTSVRAQCEPDLDDNGIPFISRLELRRIVAELDAQRAARAAAQAENAALKARLPKYDDEDVCRCLHAFDWHAPCGSCAGSQCRCDGFELLRTSNGLAPGEAQ